MEKLNLFEASEENKKTHRLQGGVDFLFSGGNTMGKAQPIQIKDYHFMEKLNLFEASKENKKSHRL